MAEPERRLDHVVIAVRDLSAAMAAYRTLGFDARPGGRHTGRGTENAIIRFGLDYLELISVFDPIEAERTGRGDLVAFLEDREGLVAYAIATSDIDAEAARLSGAGMAFTGPFAMERRRPDGTRLSWRLVVPGDTQYRRPWPFFIQWDQSDAERLERDGRGSHANGSREIAAVSVCVRDLAAAAELYGRVIGLSPTDRGFAAGDASIRLQTDAVDDEGPCAVEIVAASSRDIDPADAAGARINLRRSTDRLA